MLADKMVKTFKESTVAPEEKEKVPSYIHSMAGFRWLEAEQRRMTASCAITVTFDGGLMTNLRAEKTRRRTDDDLVPQGFVAVHTLEPLSCVVTSFYSEISFNNNGPRAGKNSIRLFPYDSVWFRIRCHVTHYSNVPTLHSFNYVGNNLHQRRS